MKRFDIWYLKHLSQIPPRHCGGDSVFTPTVTHSFVCVVYASNKEEIFDIMNGQSENHPNPLENPNAQDYLKNSDVHHTSMSVGDVVEDVLLGVKYWCDSYGWTEVQ